MNKPFRILQLTDLHLLADKQACLLGLNTWESFNAVLGEVQKRGIAYDAALLTGDLSQDGSVASYEHLLEALEPLGLTTYWIPGNHDHPLHPQQTLHNSWLRRERTFSLGDWNFILLDSTLPNSDPGGLLQPELAFLLESLDKNRASHVFIALHHHPLDLDSAWLGQPNFLNAQAFVEALEAYSNVKVVTWGHVHQEYALFKKGIHWFASPSTCVQFAPRSASFQLDRQAPGFREFTLFPDGTFTTEVHRVQNYDLSKLQVGSKGY